MYIHGVLKAEEEREVQSGTGTKFNPIQIQQVSSYVLYLPFTEGKEAQGEIIEE